MEVILEKGWVSSEFIVKSVNKDNLIISGYASVFGVIDSHNDVLVKGAFKEVDSSKVKFLWQHDVSKPIGVIKFLKEDEYGLLVEAEINNSTIAGSEASALVKQQAIGGLSIGFAIKSSDFNKSGERLIQDVELREISIVTFPANQYAEIQHLKKMDKDEELFEEDRLDELVKLINHIENY